MEDSEISTALDRNWAASDTNLFEAELCVCREDAVFPKSVERLQSCFAQPNKKRFTVGRILGAANLWITEVILTREGRWPWSASPNVAAS